MPGFKPFALNVVALCMAAGIGAVAVSQVAYVHEVPTGAVPLAPLILGFVVSILVAVIAPSTRIGVRFAVFSGIYLVDLALSVIATVAVVALVRVYFDGDTEAARPFTYAGVLIAPITGFAGWYTLRRWRIQPPDALAT